MAEPANGSASATPGSDSPGTPARPHSMHGKAKRRKTAVIESDPEDDDPVQQLSTSTSKEDSPSMSSGNAAAQFDMDTDISKLEAPTFTTLDRGPSQPMVSLHWDHGLSLIGKKVVHPMIHCCDKCLKPILFYGRMIPCKHVFCLYCAKETETASARAGKPTVCGRCGGDVLRVEQAGLGSIYMCSHGGSRYGNNGCRRTYLSQRDLQAHIQHRHMKPNPTAVAAAAAASLPPHVPSAVTSATPSGPTAALPTSLPSAEAIAEATQAIVNARKHQHGSHQHHSHQQHHRGTGRPPTTDYYSSRKSSGASAASSSSMANHLHGSARNSYSYAAPVSSSNSNSGAAPAASNTQPIAVISSTRQSNLITVPINDHVSNSGNGERTTDLGSASYHASGYAGAGGGTSHGWGKGDSRSYSHYSSASAPPPHHHHHHAGSASSSHHHHHHHHHHQSGASYGNSWRTSGHGSHQQTASSSSNYYRR